MHGRNFLAGWALALIVFLLGAATPMPVLGHGKTDDAITADQTAAAVAERWGCPMCETVRQDSAGTCSICGMDLVRMDDSVVRPDLAPVIEATYDGTVSRNPANETRNLPLMPGLPDAMFYGGALLTLMVSFVLFEFWGRRSVSGGRGKRLDLLSIPGLRALVKRRGFQFVLQLPIVLLFGVVLIAGFFGNPAPERNIAPILTWTVWWAWLVIAILFVGKLWCTVCPWMAIADWIGKRSLWRRVRDDLRLNLRWPRRLRNIWIATAMFVGLTWLELGYGVTDTPWVTAALGLFMTALAIATILIFERKAFCRYACLVGRVSGLYSMFSASELRTRSAEVCRKCETKDCYNGNERGYPCPTNQFIGAMETNTYCTLCTECIKSCPEDNIVWNLRPFGSDLLEPHRTRVDEGYLAVIMLSMSAFHGLTMTPAWDQIVTWIQRATGVGWLGAFSIGMAGVLVLPLLIYYGICWVMKRLAGDREHSTRFLFIRFAYSLLPIALFYHLAHNLQHIFYEGMKLVRVASDPFGLGWNLFGTATMAVHAMIPVRAGWTIQVALILVGHVYGIYIAHRVAATLYGNSRAATLSQLPMLVAMMLFSFQSLWLVAQPMVMRTAM